jgi:hypothetical protein
LRLIVNYLKATTLAREGQVFMPAVFTLHASKAVVQMAAFQIPINKLLKIRPPEYVLPREMFIIHLDKGFKTTIPLMHLHIVFEHFEEDCNTNIGI